MLNFLPQYTIEVTDTTGTDPTTIYTNGVGSAVVTGTNESGSLYATLQNGTIPGQIFALIITAETLDGVILGGSLNLSGNALFVWDGFGAIWQQVGQQ